MKTSVVVQNVGFARGAHTLRFVLDRGVVSVKVLDSALDNPKPGQTPVFPLMRVSRDDDGLYSATVVGSPDQVWGDNAARAFSRGVRAFWTVRASK